MNPPRTPIFIAGATATGKSAVALHLARRIGGEIISVDSMQVYRGLDLGTAKPSPEERALVPHHLIDVVDLTGTFDAAQFVRLAREAVADIESRGRVPVFCGGTGFYFKAYLEGIGEGPPADLTLRSELERTPLAGLLEELQRRDPELFAKIDRRNPRRVVRAIEVIRLTGKPFSGQRAQWSGDSAGLSRVPSAEATQVFCLSRAPEDLHDRINRRVDVMFEKGLVAETERLLAQGLVQNRTAMQAIGYRQVAEHLRGERSLAETIALVKLKTRQFARRQATWFRHQLRAEQIEIRPGDREEAVAGQLAARTASE